MALPLSLRFPIASPAATQKPTPLTLNLSHQSPPPPHFNPSPFLRSRRIWANRFVINAIEGGGRQDDKKEESSSETTTTQQQNPPEEPESASELGSQIRKAMREREESKDRDGGLLGGVAEEIEKIEWPVFGKVLGTTGLVIGVIAGSSVVLLTVNAILAELSDRVFAGRGVQDFFGP
ncbi:preprotein translocase subunit SECE1 [Malania oleifera]|uniref:preprotein translocase subunit SECE1 n=1 Tax=Malania oleifera TaxID=397392 RepID=UPI0025AEB031|nr:preprotein translocase subunit SECE1 [Malania oleifera]